MIDPSVIKDRLSCLNSVGNAIDSGGQKSVYPCTMNGGQYALKLIRLPKIESEEELADREAVEKRAQREIDIMNKLDNPNLVKPGPISLETFSEQSEDFLCFSEEWIDGQDLSARVQNGHLLSQDESWNLALQLLSVIGDLWSHRLLHRDISARNIMVRRDGTFVLIDLGYAFDFLSPSLTRHHGTPGTLHYIAPERFNLARKRYIDHRADQFSLGIVLYVCLTGQHPYYSTGMTSEDYVDVVCNSTALPDKPSDILTNSSAELDKLVMRLISRKPHFRFRTCADACKFIEEERV